MKRFAAVLTVMLWLSFPALGGHRPIGGWYCEPCDGITCICDSGEMADGNRTNQQSDAPIDSSELGIVVVALLFWLRLRA